jgi:predicted nucleic acid-binding protein
VCEFVEAGPDHSRVVARRSSLMPFVLDASIALAWYLPGQGNAYAAAIYERLNGGADQASAPLLWRAELASVLLRSHRRGDISEARALQALADAEQLPIALFDIQLTGTDIFRLGRRYRLSGYDAVYVELARRLDLPIASADRGIRSAAARHGISIFGE